MRHLSQPAPAAKSSSPFGILPFCAGLTAVMWLGNAYLGWTLPMWLVLLPVLCWGAIAGLLFLILITAPIWIIIAAFVATKPVKPTAASLRRQSLRGR